MNWPTLLVWFYFGGVLAVAPPAFARHWRGLASGGAFFYVTLLWPIAMAQATQRTLRQCTHCAMGSMRNDPPLGIEPQLREELEKNFGTLFTMCRYEVEPSDNVESLELLCNQAGIKIEEVNALNKAKAPSEYWQPGRTVLLPRAIGLVLEKRESSGASSDAE